VEFAQTPLEIVHLRVTLFPEVMLLTVVVLEDGLVILAVPLTTDHWPLPTAGLLAAMVKEEVLHKVWSGPAAETVGS